MVARKAPKGQRLSAAGRICGHCGEIGWEDRRNALNARALMEPTQRARRSAGSILALQVKRCASELYHVRA